MNLASPDFGREKQLSEDGQQIAPIERTHEILDT
jgi:hypothetical protein